MLREKTVGASLCRDFAEGSLGASAVNGLFYVAAGGIPRYGIMECVDIYISANSGGTTEFFRPEAVYRLRGVFICPMPK